MTVRASDREAIAAWHDGEAARLIAEADQEPDPHASTTIALRANVHASSATAIRAGAAAQKLPAVETERPDWWDDAALAIAPQLLKLTAKGREALAAQNLEFFSLAELSLLFGIVASVEAARLIARTDNPATAREVLTYLFAESEWEEDVDSDCEGGVQRVYVNHHVRIRDSLLDELLDMAGIKQARYDESPLEPLTRANDEDQSALLTARKEGGG
jgi:hypothetical protein